MGNAGSQNHSALSLPTGRGTSFQEILPSRLFLEMIWLVKAPLLLLVGITAVFAVAAFYIRSRRQRKHTVAFFHPYWYVKFL